jgi:soluble lytic murein transglycosylase
MQKRRILIVMTAALLGAAAWAQTSSLPDGLTQQGGVISMQPIQDSDQASSEDEPEHRTGTSHVLSPADHDLFTKAFEAIERGDWPAATGSAAQGHDPIAKRLVQWRFLLDKNSGASFAEIDAFLKANPEWPSRGSLFARAEAAIDPAASPATIIAWFGDRTPVSAVGKIRLGEAEIAAGKTTLGRNLIRQGWVEGSFEPAQELAIVQKDGALISPDADRERLDNLLWRDDVSGARREMARVDDTAQRLAAARIDLRMNPRGAQRDMAGLSADVISDPSLLFDRARAARRAGDSDGAVVLLQRAPLRELARLHPTKLWSELSIAIRQALQEGNSKAAYGMASDCGFTSGSEFADAEFLAGWIALRFLKDPQTALTHFKKLGDGVSRPISLSRARYWSGRAYEEAGDPASAWQQYHLAAKAPDTFYGQLALARIDATPLLHLRNVAIDATLSRAAFEREEPVRAMQVLADLGEQDFLRTFALDYQELHPDAGHVKLLAEMLVETGFRDVAVRVAKAASYNDIPLLTYTHPVIALPPYSGPGPAPEPALVLGIMRQETEFDAASVSHAGARGIMQIMPHDARRLARLSNLPYRPNDLTSDTNYNMQLGMTEFSSYLSDWGNSLILAAAAYNAGPSNARRWIATFGDPRSPSVDPIDWIEEIPFGETRNYVQRVIENLEVYRNRLAGRDQPLRIMTDLYAPNTPPSKVLIYTPPPVAAPTALPKPKPSDTTSGLR